MKGASEQAGKTKVPKKVAFQVDNDLLTVGSDEPFNEINPRPLAQDRIESVLPLAGEAGGIDGFRGPRKAPNTQRSTSPDQLDEQFHHSSTAPTPGAGTGIMIENLDTSSVGQDYKSQSSQQRSPNLLGIKVPKKGRQPSLIEAAELLDIDSGPRHY